MARIQKMVGYSRAAQTSHARANRVRPVVPSSTWSSRAMPKNAAIQKPHGGVAAASSSPASSART